MTELLPSADLVGHHSVAGMLETVAAGGVELPPMVVVDSGETDWRRLVVSRSAVERRRSVVAASSIASLVDAVRLGFGGALWMPPSTPSVEAACEAAASTSRGEGGPTVSHAVLEMVASSASELQAVCWTPRSFWDRQIGASSLIGWLHSVADELDVVPAVVPWPALVVADRSRAEIETACNAAIDDHGALAEVQPTKVNLTGAVGSPDPRTIIETKLAAVDRGARETAATAGVPRPVHELPHGRRVGWWAPNEVEVPPGEGWLAVPFEAGSIGHVWRMSGGSGDPVTVVDAAAIDEKDSAPGTVLRVPGWIASGVRRGSPSGLLVEGMARHPRREGRPLWVPNVDVDAVRFLLSLPGPIWVDGPGVPKG